MNLGNGCFILETICLSPSGVTFILLKEMTSAPVIVQLWELLHLPKSSQRKRDHRLLTQKVNLFTARMLVQVTGKEPKYGT